MKDVNNFKTSTIRLGADVIVCSPKNYNYPISLILYVPESKDTEERSRVKHELDTQA